MSKKIIALAAALFCVTTFGAFSQNAEKVEDETQAVATVSQEEAVAETQTVQEEKSSSSGLKYVAAALAVCVACLAGGLAVGKIGAAAMGAMSENPELSGKALPFVGLAEGICLWGFLVALLIIIL